MLDSHEYTLCRPPPHDRYVDDICETAKIAIRATTKNNTPSFHHVIEQMREYSLIRHITGFGSFQ